VITIIYLSQILNSKIFDSQGKEIGVLEDLIILDGEKHAEIVALACRKNNELFRIPINHVSIIGKKINLTVIKEKAFSFGNVQNDDLKLKGLVLDKQLIDVDGLKVVRVNDVALANVHNKFCVIGVDVGIRGFIRRLSMLKVLEKIIPAKASNNLLAWEFVAPLEPDPMHVHLKIPRNSLKELHPADLADLMEELSHEERAMIFRALDEETAADTLIEAEPSVQKSLVQSIKVKKIASVFEKMSPDEIADIITMMDKEKAEELFEILPPHIVKHVKEILRYSEDSAGAIMSTEFITIPWNYTAEQTINKMRELSPSAAHIYYIYVVKESNELMGVLSLRHLITADPNKRVCDFMNTEMLKVHTSTSKRDMAKLFSKYGLLALPVVDEKGILKGVVTADEVIETVMPQAWARTKVYHKRKRTTKNNGEIDKKIKEKNKQAQHDTRTAECNTEN